MATRRNYFCLGKQELQSTAFSFFFSPAETCTDPVFSKTLLLSLSKTGVLISRMINTVNPLGWDFQKNLKRKPQWKKRRSPAPWPSLCVALLLAPGSGDTQGWAPWHRFPLPSSGDTHLKHHIKV